MKSCVYLAAAVLSAAGIVGCESSSVSRYDDGRSSYSASGDQGLSAGSSGSTGNASPGQYDASRQTGDTSGSRIVTSTGTSYNDQNGRTVASGSNSTDQNAGNNSSSANLGDVDRTFVTQAASGGMYEVRSSQLALQQSNSDDVKRIAQHMIDDHQKANQQLMNIAQRKNINVSQDLSNKDKGLLDQLNGVKGNDFDTAYLKQQLQAHQDTIDLFQREANNGQDSDLKSFASQTLPTLKDHLQMIKDSNKIATER